MLIQTVIDHIKRVSKEYLKGSRLMEAARIRFCMQPSPKECTGITHHLHRQVWMS